MIGKTISHYKIIEKLGEGGMGEVYLAEDTSLDRKVALKFLPKAYTADANAISRFKREAKAVAKLNHPNIITVYEISEFEDTTFIAMEYVEGSSLRDVIKEGEMSIDIVKNIATQICEGLNEAHKVGITHRDIKPENILIDRQGRVKVLDFGLAQIKGANRLTKETSTLGTLKYMSPEQYKRSKIDHRTDIWSFGVVLFEILTGELPFRGEYEAALMYSVVNEEPKSLISLRHDTPQNLQQIVSKTLEKDPENRYQNIEDILIELKKTQPITVKEPEQEKSIVVLPFVNMSPDPEQEYFSDGLTEEIITDLSHIHDLLVISRSSAMTFKGTKKKIKEIAKEVNVRYVLEGSVRKAGNNLRITAQLIDAITDAHLWAEKYSGTLDDVFDIQEKVSRSIVDALKLKLTAKEDAQIAERPIDNVFAYECYLKAKQEIHRWTEESLNRALQHLKNGLDIIGENALLYAGMGYVYYQYVNAGFKQEDYISKVEDCIKKVFELEPDSSQGHFLLGLINQAFLGNQKQSIHHLKLALVANHNDSEVLIWLSMGYICVGKMDVSTPLVEKLLQINPLNPVSHFMLSLLRYYEGRFEDALESLHKCNQMEL
jgi:non-specific serine/threonine protein kinase